VKLRVSEYLRRVKRNQKRKKNSQRHKRVKIGGETRVTTGRDTRVKAFSKGEGSVDGETDIGPIALCGESGRGGNHREESGRGERRIETRKKMWRANLKSKWFNNPTIVEKVMLSGGGGGDGRRLRKYRSNKFASPGAAQTHRSRGEKVQEPGRGKGQIPTYGATLFVPGTQEAKQCLFKYG